MISVRQWPEEATRTPNSACYWIAETTIDGQEYSARSRHGAARELARVLVAAGIPDAPMEVHSAGLRGHLTFGSFHAAAIWTFTEGNTPLQRVRWQDPALRYASTPCVDAPNVGVKPSGGIEIASDETPPVLSLSEAAI
jgi:hypothetical protein